MRRAIVTGGHGFIGRHLVEALERDGWQAVAAGRPNLELPSSGFDQLVERTAPELVVHCATPASVGGSLQDPHGDLVGSVVVLSALLDSLRAADARPRVLLVSSAAVYGQPASLPVTEEAAVAPISPYGLHRAMCESTLADRARAREVPYAIARIFTAYGAGLRRQLLWDICRMALDDGTVRLGGNGTETRDFLHVTDVAGALAAMAQHSAFAGETVNVASGRGTPIADVAHQLAGALGLAEDSVSFSGVRRPGDPPAWVADVSRLAALGFAATMPLERGLRQYAGWATKALRSAAVEL